MKSKRLSEYTELFELLHNVDICPPPPVTICLDEMVRLHESEVENWREKVVWGFYDNEIPEYIQG